MGRRSWDRLPISPALLRVSRHAIEELLDLDICEWGGLPQVESIYGYLAADDPFSTRILSLYLLYF